MKVESPTWVGATSGFKRKRITERLKNLSKEFSCVPLQGRQHLELKFTIDKCYIHQHHSCAEEINTIKKNLKICHLQYLV